MIKGEYTNHKIEYNKEQLEFINSPVENSKLFKWHRNQHPNFKNI